MLQHEVGLVDERVFKEGHEFDDSVSAQLLKNLTLILGGPFDADVMSLADFDDELLTGRGTLPFRILVDFVGVSSRQVYW